MNGPFVWCILFAFRTQASFTSTCERRNNLINLHPCARLTNSQSSSKLSQLKRMFHVKHVKCLISCEGSLHVFACNLILKCWMWCQVFPRTVTCCNWEQEMILFLNCMSMGGCFFFDMIFSILFFFDISTYWIWLNRTSNTCPCTILFGVGKVASFYPSPFD